MEIKGDVVRSMVDRFDLVIFWHFSMVGIICAVDLYHSIIVLFLFSFLCFVLGSIILVVISLLTFVVVFVTLSFKE